MNQELEKLYNAIKQLEDLGLPVSKEQIKSLEQAEANYISNELLPCMEAVATPLLKGLKQAVTLVIDYNPEQGVVVKPGSRKLGRCGRKPKGYKEELDDQNEVMKMGEDTSHHEDDAEILLNHPLDWSPFEYGFTIEHKYHEAIFEAVGHYLQRGTGIDITLLFKGDRYDAKITNANRQVKGDTIRLLYRGKKNHLGMRLSKEFPEVYNYIKQFKEVHGGRAQCKLPLDLQRTIKMYKTDQNDVYRIEIE